MKKNLLFAAICGVILAGCTSSDAPTQTQSVTFSVATFSQDVQKAPAATILDDENGTELTDLYVFDGTSELIHQTSDADDFGTVTLNLLHGAHSLSFILTRSTGLSVSDGILSITSVRSTFGKLFTLTVSSSTPSQSIILDRISGQTSITINDVFPAEANQIEFVINPRYMQLDVTTLEGVNGASWSQKVSCTSKVGQSGVSYTFNHICPSLTEEITADVTLNVYNSSNTIIYSVTIKDVRLASNTKTLISGNLFTAPSASVSVNTTWKTSIVGTW